MRCKQDMMEEHLSMLLSYTQILQPVKTKVKTWAISRGFRLIPKIVSPQQLILPISGTMKLNITILMIQATYPQESRSDISQLWFGETHAKLDAVSLKTSLFAVTRHQVTS